MIWTQKSLNIIDLLRTNPTTVPFQQRVDELQLSSTLAEKITGCLEKTASSTHDRGRQTNLTEQEEKELATEVLLLRHRFTEIVITSRIFRQAVLTIIQNIYLFKHRKIFFSTTAPDTTTERQEALMLLSDWKPGNSIALSKTFQHLIIARVWNRIVSQSTEPERNRSAFIELHAVVEKLNTIRNIYMLLSAGLVKNLIRNINHIYRQSTPPEDAVQIGNFGIARAAYRYHPSIGVRFSTYAARWVQKEIQRQSLENRLIRISSNIVENYAKAAKTGDTDCLKKSAVIFARTSICNTDQKADGNREPHSSLVLSPETLAENKQMSRLLEDAIDKTLSQKSADIIKRRYGLSPYVQEQSVIEIGATYGVTRSNIYQLEQTALKKLRKTLEKHHYSAAK